MSIVRYSRGMARDRFRLSRQEELTSQAVFALLLSQGRVITDVGRPPLGGSRSPDFIFRLDGQPGALEVVRYLDRQDAQKAMSRVILVEHALQERLKPDAMAIHGKVAIALRYSVAALQTHKRADVGVDADQLAVDVRAAMKQRTPNDDNLVEILTSVRWVIHVQVSVWPSDEPGAYFSIAPGLPDGTPDPDGFVERTIHSKADQHLGYASRAILVVLGMFHDDAEDLTAAFERWSGPVPWWRVYFVRSDATLIYQQSSPP